MTNKLIEFLNMKYSELAVSLLFGASYFAIILDFIMKNTQRAGGLLGLFVAPAVICGIALVFIKLIKRMKENEEYKKIVLFMAVNTIVLVYSVLTIALNLIYGA